MKVRDLQKAWIVLVSFYKGSQAVCCVFVRVVVCGVESLWKEVGQSRIR